MTTSGIDNISSTETNPVSCINPSGEVFSQPVKGLNIIKMSDSSVKKLISR